MEGRPSGTVTFLFTDIEGSTRLWDAHPEAMALALARHDEILRGSISVWKGHVFSTSGDGLAAVFHRAGDAVGAAVSAQRALRAERWPDPVVLGVRMGVHSGEAEERDGDYFGRPVNQAARLMTAAHGGQVLVSEVTAGIVGPVFEVVELGVLRARGLSEPMRVFAVRADGLAAADQPIAATEQTRGNLPRLATEWFGPVSEVRRMASELTKRRLVTLTGTGGVGKTRLALEAAWLGLDEFGDGCWLVELASVADPGAVGAAVASTMSIRMQPALTVVDSIVDWLRDRRLLLVLDNCEHVLGPVAELVSAITARCPAVTVLATSREPLGVAGERVEVVRSLALSDAVALFADRATAASGSIHQTDRVAVNEICDRLDGIPLAIELAAARTRSFTATELRDRLNDRFRLLRGSGRGGLERHQTLRAAVAWSYQLLTDNERLLFDRLSVFAGSFDLTAAETVGADDALDESEIVDVLASLVDKSMVVAEHTSTTTRYRLLETLRQYGEEQLDNRGDTESLRDRHVRHYLDVAERAAPIVMSARQADGQAIFAREWDNLRAAVSWAITTQDLHRAEKLVHESGAFAYIQLRHEHGRWADAVLELATPTRRPSADMFGHAADWCVVSGDHERAVTLTRAGIEGAPSPKDPATVMCWAKLAAANLLLGRFDDALTAIVEGRDAADATIDPWRKWMFLYDAAAVAVLVDPASAEPHLDRLAAFAEQIGAPTARAAAGFWRGEALFQADTPDGTAAASAYKEALELTRQVDDHAFSGVVLMGLCWTLALAESPDAIPTIRDAIFHLYADRYWLMLLYTIEAAAVVMAANRHLQPAATTYGHLEAAGFRVLNTVFGTAREQALAAIRAHPDSQSWKATGAAMSRDELVTYMLQQLDEHS